jgi:peroxiredoxin
MRNFAILVALVFMIGGGFLIGGSASATSARVVEGEIPAAPAIGATIEDFTLPDVTGTERSLKSLAGKKGTVLLFVAVQCPVSNAYNERMEKLAQDYKAKGIAVIGINSNVKEDADAVRGHAAENKLSFPILKDPSNKIADKLGATVTPEAYFLDANNKLVYHGRIDNSRNADQIETSDLRNALDAVLAGKAIEKPEAKAFGCTIKRA